jgi:hypothetical protein
VHCNICCKKLDFDGEGYQYLTIFERRILKKIFGPSQDTAGWRIRTLHELNKLIGGANMLRSIKAQTLKWWGH